ncbi:hypothetical protein OMAG_002949, partial [Candidatus Omnitrophus magneticus]
MRVSDEIEKLRGIAEGEVKKELDRISKRIKDVCPDVRKTEKKEEEIAVKKILVSEKICDAERFYQYLEEKIDATETTRIYGILEREDFLNKMKQVSEKSLSE